MEIATDIDLGLWLQLQDPRVVELFVDVCDRQALEQDEASAFELFAAVGQAVLEGRDPVAVQRKCAPLLGDYYEQDEAL